MPAVPALAVLTALVAAIRSTWSPCGESVLSTITPLSEPGRGNRWGVTAGAFVVGSIAGGVVIGGVAAVLALPASMLPTTAALAVAAVAAGAAAVLDQRSAGRGLPPRRRQLDEQDSTAFRGWVYGAWWGLQVGCGLATISMTAGVYLTFVLAALTGEPLAALATGALFGLVRGLGVLPARRHHTFEAMQSFHRRMDALDDATRRAALVWLVAAAPFAASLALGAAAPVAAGVALVVAAVAVPLSRRGPVDQACTARTRSAANSTTPSTITATTHRSRPEVRAGAAPS